MRLTIYVPLCLFILSLLSLSSCKREKNKGLKELNKIVVPIQYSSKKIIEEQKKITQKWWEEFKNDSLNKLIEKALENNFTIKSAHNRLGLSQAIAKVGGSAKYPQINGSLSGSRTNAKIKGFPSTNSNRFAVGLAVSYEIDFTGRIKNQVEALDYTVLATQEDISIAIISTAAQITITWYRLHDAYQQKINTQEQWRLQKKDTSFAKTQFKNGQSPLSTLWQKQQAELLTSNELLQITSSIKILENSMSILTGFPPGSYQFKYNEIKFSLSEQPSIGIPLDLIQTRPDIRKAYFDLLSADKKIAAAIKDRFPKLSLSANSETSEEKVSNLFKNWLTTLAGNLIAPLIDGGRRKAEVEKQKANYRLLLNQYGSTVINAIKEVEDALIQEQAQKAIQQSHLKQIRLTKNIMQIASNNYRANQIDLSIYYQTRINHASANKQLSSSQRELIEARINLYKALANTWSEKSEKQKKKEK